MLFQLPGRDRRQPWLPLGPDLFAIATWGKDRSEAEYLDRVLCEKWEAVLPELTFEPRNSH